MRIITGTYKGRHFDIPRSFKARPTTDFAKENIFNVLNGYTDFDGATALDLFSGTGSISLELLSRGCRQVVSIELDRDHHRFIQQCWEKIKGTKNERSNGEEEETRDEKRGELIPIRGDVFKFLKSCRQQFDIIFADPPYTLEQLPQIPDIVLQKGILKPGGIFVFEHGKNNRFDTHPRFVEHRQYGSVNFSLFR